MSAPRLRVSCLEPGRHPAVADVVVGEGDPLVLLLLAPGEDPALRRTLIRHPRDGAPPGADAVVELSLRSGAASGGVGFVVDRVSGRLPIEQRLAGGRRRLVSGDALPSGAIVELAVEGLERVELRLLVEDAALRSARRSVGGSGTRRSQAAGSAGWVWLVPPVAAVLVDVGNWVEENFFGVASRLGLTRRRAALLFGALMLAGSYVALVAWRTQELDAAQAKADAAQEAARNAEAAAQAALASELVCLEDRRALAERAGAEEAARSLAVEAALGLSVARAVALELGGARFGAEAVLTRDAYGRADLVAHVAALARSDEARGGDAPERCLGHEAALGSDLPRYALLWHPDPDQACPDAYEAVLQGRRVTGRWGLSDRVARHAGGADRGPPADLAARLVSVAAAPGAPAPDPAALADPRLEDRWAARALAGGLRAAQQVVLEHAGERVSVLPGQAQLWALALFAAYDALPTLGDPALDGDLATCVDALLDGLEADPTPAAPGDTLLPDIVAVAVGEARVPTAPTAACPWPSDAVEVGARSALLAAARLVRASPAGGG